MVVSSFSCSGISTGDLNPIYNVPMLGTHNFLHFTARPAPKVRASVRYKMKTVFAFLTICLMGAASANDRHVRFDVGSTPTWLPVTLTAEERVLLEKRSDPPRTALDYYLLLPGMYFKNVADGLERRITFVDQGTLSDQYIHAEYTIPSTDAGFFSITIRLFGDEDKPIVRICHRSGDRWLLFAKQNGPQSTGTSPD
jgi:hypothetical protein